MAPRPRVSTGDTSLADFATDPSIVDEPQLPVINRTVSKAPKKRSVIMKKTATTAKSTTSRKPLKDRTNMKDATDDETEPVAVKPKSRKASTKAADESNEPKAKRARSTKTTADEPKKTAKPRAKRAASPENLRTIPETQVPQDVSETIEADSEHMDIDMQEAAQEPERIVAPVRSASKQRHGGQHNAPDRARSASVQRRPFSREGSATLPARLADSEARRKLADMTSKYEDMRLRYESLSELGTSAAESNFDKLKRATDTRAKDGADLIASLKKELSEARASTSTHHAENAKLQTRVTALQTAHEEGKSEARELKATLAEAQNEVKALAAKLEAAREAARKAAAEAAKVAPGSAVKSRDRNLALATGSLDGAKQAALKEELYRDLTGLIINSVKRRDGEDEYSCIQTGRNGTLHFHLSVSNDATQMNPKTPSGLSYEDAEFAYEPFFDEGRDRDLMDILPDYLTEEICFPRSHAVRFYTKIVDSMTKKVVLEEE